MSKVLKQMVVLGCVLPVVGMTSAEARPRVSDVKKEEVNINRAEKRLAAKLSKLTAAERVQVKAKVVGIDSDGDGVSDILERGLGSNRCDSDSDNDGFDDKSDSNEDTAGSDDGLAEFEVKGLVESISALLVRINGVDYSLTDSTVFRGAGFSVDDLGVGVCVEVKGLSRSSGKTVTLVKRDDSCGSDD